MGNRNEAPVREDPLKPMPDLRNKITMIVAAGGIVIGMVFLLNWMSKRHQLGAPAVVVAGELSGGRLEIVLPKDVAGFTSSNLPISEIEVSTLPSDTSFGRSQYVDADGFAVDVTVVLMGTDRTSIHKPEFCLNGAGWPIIQTDRVAIAMENGSQLGATKLLVEKKIKYEGRDVLLRGIYTYWFVADGVATDSHKERMWLMAKTLLTKGVLQRWAYVSCFTWNVEGNEERLWEKTQGFIREIGPRIHPGLPLLQ